MSSTVFLDNSYTHLKDGTHLDWIDSSHVDWTALVVLYFGGDTTLSAIFAVSSDGNHMFGLTDMTALLHPGFAIHYEKQ